jgi:hypothetical protein
MIPFAGQDGDLAAGELGDLPCPRTRRVDDHFGPDSDLVSGERALDTGPEDPAAAAL